MKQIKPFAFLFLCVFLFACEKERVKTITVFNTGDINGMLWSRQDPEYNNKETGGLAVLKNMLQTQRGEYILLDTGNWFAGTPEGSLDKGSKTIAVMNMVGYAAAGIGSEDVDIGKDSAEKNLKEAEFTVLSANLTPLPSTKKNMVYELDGVKIGLFSVMPASVTLDSSRRIPFSIKDEFNAAREQVSDLKKQDADIIILLLNTDIEDASYTEENFAEEVDGIDLILASASSLGGAPLSKINNTYIARTERLLRAVNKTKITLDKDNKILTVSAEEAPLFKEKYGEDPEVLEVTDKLRKETQNKLKNVISEALEEIPAYGAAQSPLGSLAADCLKEWSKADIGILNSDSLRLGLKKGKISEYMIYELYPYNDTVMSVKIRGEKIKEILEGAVTSPENFPQISGLRAKYDPSAPAGQRISDILINGSRVRPDYIYTIATTDHIVSGGLNTDAFIEAVEFKNTQVDARVVLRICMVRKRKLSPPPLTQWH